MNYEKKQWDPLLFTNICCWENQERKPPTNFAVAATTEILCTNRQRENVKIHRQITELYRFYT
jgi:hypothetical protein